MLYLDSDQWRELCHAYGSAEGIPALLRQLPAAPVKSSEGESEPWHTLWSALCHQSDVYPASYAALPYVIESAGSRKPSDRAEYLFLAGTIEAMRHKPSSPLIPTELEPPYNEALQTAIPLALEALRVESNESWFQGLLAALAAFRGFPKISAAIADLERQLDCPSCDSTFIAPGYDCFE